MVNKWFSLCPLLLAVIVLTLPPLSDAVPWQCEELRNIVHPCTCQGKVGDESLVVIVCNHNLLEVPDFASQGTSNHTIYEMTLAKNKIQTIPADRFKTLKIQRLDFTGNLLTTISINAFQGLENGLLELKIGAQIGSSISIPRASLTNLTALHTLHLEHFRFPNDDVEVGSGLRELTNLKSLTLAYNYFISMSSGSLPENISTLTLDHQNLSSIPVDMLRSLRKLQSLTITNTFINSIHHSAFEQNKQLKTLDLSYNTINSLDPQCFNGITTTLQSLSMRNNPLSSVNTINPLKYLTALTSLQLSNIGLASLPTEPEFLSNKASLVSLHLDNNDLTTLAPDVFSSLKNSLQKLSLSNNQLRTITDQSLSGLSKLMSLDLSYQTIPSSQKLVLPASLGTVVSLQTLKLSSTPLDQGALWQAVSPLSALETLHVDSTSLTSIKDHSLMNLTQLVELNLENNNLSALTQAMLAGPRDLTKLWVNHNNITTMSRCVFHGFTLSPTLELHLNGNPLHCDCQLDWLLTEISQMRIKLLGFETCATPQNLQGKQINQFSPGDFICVPGQPAQAPCSELYTTAAPPTTTPEPDIVLEITKVTFTSVHLSWTITHISDVRDFKVSHLELEQGSVLELSKSIGKEKRSWEVSGLKEGTLYSFCLKVTRLGSPTLNECIRNTTLGNTQDPDKQEQNGKDDSETGVIIGVVVGVLVLLAILGAILYIVVLRKRSTKKEPPVQPHTFTASELPGMGPDTRHFTQPSEEPRKREKPKVGRALDADVMVTVISDGRTGPKNPTDRQSAGSYQFLDEKHPNSNPGMAPSDAGYKDMSRALPSAPTDNMEGYYNHGFNRGSNSHHVYNQIDL